MIINNFVCGLLIIITITNDILINGQTGQADICPCDILANSCDINCCCDKDCDDYDKKVFSECTDYSRSFDPKLCVQKNVIVFNNTDYPTQYDKNNLLCIYYDNYASRNFYIEPMIVDSLEKFREYENSYANRNGFNNDSHLQSGNMEILNPYYKVGDDILIVFDNNQLAQFLLPRSGLTTFCTYNTAAEFLINKVHNCVQSTLKLADECNLAWHMNAANYYTKFALLKNLKNVPNTNVLQTQSNGTGRLPDSTIAKDLINIDVAVHVEDQEDNNTVDFAVMPKPQYVSATKMCKNVPYKVQYDVKISKEGDIQSASLKIFLRNVHSSENYFKREFSIAFKMLSNKENVSSEEGIVRSGNPGYGFGLPVMAGEATFNDTREAILLNVDNQQWLTTVASGADGLCKNSVIRKPILFGINQESGCIIV